MTIPHVSALRRYPVKSLAGHPVEQLTIDRSGPQGDRTWMLVLPDGQGLTAREQPELMLVRPELTATGLTIRAEGRGDLAVTIPTGPTDIPVKVHSTELLASSAGNGADAWFSEVLGTPLRLVYLGDPDIRPVRPDYAEPDDRVSFADGFPLLLTSTESLDALNDLVAAGRFPDEWPLSMTRFRPNVVVSGMPAAWAEDGWRRIRIGDAIFRTPKGCDRCVMTTVDPDTAARGREPLASLVKHRRWDGKSWFGMNLIPDTPGTQIRLGDQIEILESVPDPDGPPR